ncbi:MAG: uridine kinase family protein [Candidatus Woesearchaeota archaeon]
MIDRNFEKVQGKYRMRGELPFKREKIEAVLRKNRDEIGPFSEAVISPNIFGRNVMLPYRGINDNEVRTDDDIIQILTDKIIGRMNSFNKLPLYVHSSPFHPNPAYSPNVQSIHDHVIYTLMQEGFLDHAEAYLYHRSINAHMGKFGDLAPEHKLFHGYPSPEFKQEIERLYSQNGYDQQMQINEMLNEEKPFAEMIELFDSVYKENVRGAFKQMLDTKPNVRVLSITGKSSSGKTTTTHLLCDMIKKEMGMNLVDLSIDMYFTDYQPRDARGDINYELFESLDLALLREHLPRLIAGEKVKTPIYNFKKGGREPESEWVEKQIDDNSILVIDSHYSLIPVIREMLDSNDKPSIKDEQRFYVYLEPFNHVYDNQGELIHMSRYNMLRRWRRDIEHRNTPYEFNIPHWWTVRRGELRDIVPRMKLADVVINSGLPGELNFMSAVFQDEFSLPSAQIFLDNGQLYGAIRCHQAKQLLSQAQPVPREYITSDKVLPYTSILREFVGGSAFTGKHI